jgi:hypothetical protein
MKRSIEMNALWFLGFTWIMTASWKLVDVAGTAYLQIVRRFGPIHVLSSG